MFLLSSSPQFSPILLLPTLVVIGLFIVRRLFFWARKSRIHRWPTVQGKIVNTTIHERPVHSGIWTAELVYSCKVEGQVHAGQYKRRFDDLEEALEFVRDLKDRPIAIHYRPVKPLHSALDEEDLRTLLARRPRVAPELLQVTAAPVSLWIKIWAYPLMVVASAGFAVSLYVHINSLLGVVSVSQDCFVILHLGIFVVFGPGILVLVKTGRRNISKRQLEQLPVMLRGAICVFGLYAMLNSAIFSFRAAYQPKLGPQGPLPFRNFSGGWMIFYLVSIAMLYLGTHPQNVTAIQQPDGN